MSQQIVNQYIQIEAVKIAKGKYECSTGAVNLIVEHQYNDQAQQGDSWSPDWVIIPTRLKRVMLVLNNLQKY